MVGKVRLGEVCTYNGTDMQSRGLILQLKFHLVFRQARIDYSQMTWVDPIVCQPNYFSITLQLTLSSRRYSRVVNTTAKLKY